MARMQMYMTYIVALLAAKERRIAAFFYSPHPA